MAVNQFEYFVFHKLAFWVRLKASESEAEAVFFRQRRPGGSGVGHLQSLGRPLETEGGSGLTPGCGGKE